MGLQDSISKGSPDIQNQEDMILLEGRKDITVGGKQFWLQNLSAKEHTNDGLRSLSTEALPKLKHPPETPLNI